MSHRTYVFASDRIEFIQKLIIADDENERTNALNKLEEMQKSDFKEIFSIMEGRRLLYVYLIHLYMSFAPQSIYYRENCQITE